MQAAPAPDALLALWEGALGLGGGARDALLLQAAAVEPQSAPPQTLGEGNARLLALHARWFGRHLELLSHCPACDAVAQFEGDCEAFAAQMQPRLTQAAPFRLALHGCVVHFRLPERADIDASASAGSSSEDAFAHALLERCLLDCTQGGQPCAPGALPPAVLDALSREMAALDPGASVSFALSCPACASAWQARLDVGEMLWLKLRAAAERLLLEVDALARAYAWTEAEVLRLSPTRRAAYLQMVGRT